MAYSEKQIAEAVSTVHMNSKRQARRNETINYANGDINFIGDCCFAYSGTITVTGGSSANTTMLNFKTGPSYLVTEVQPFATERGNAQLYFEVDFNDVEIVKTEFDSSGSINPMLDSPIKLVIPPFTKVHVKAGIETGTNKNWAVTLTGKVYSGAEVIQGAI